MEQFTRICVDKVSAVELAKNPTSHETSKHIDTGLHFLREQVARKELVYCRNKEQDANILTKPLKLESFMNYGGMLSFIQIRI